MVDRKVPVLRVFLRDTGTAPNVLPERVLVVWVPVVPVVPVVSLREYTQIFFFTFFFRFFFQPISWGNSYVFLLISTGTTGTTGTLKVEVLLWSGFGGSSDS